MNWRINNATDNISILIAHQDGYMRGWGIVFGSKSDEAAYIYVPPKRRRKGIGTALVRKLAKRYKRVAIFPHDKRSKGFFALFTKDERNILAHTP